MTRPLHFLAWLVALGLLAGCATYHSEPISVEGRADAFRARGLAEEGLRSFLESNGVSGDWPRRSWDLNALTLAAFYFHPDLDLARARWRSATAGKATAAQRPNPNLSFTPRLNSSSIGTGLTPWILGGMLDIPIETMGKRKYRVAQAGHLSEMAKFDLASVAWLVRSRVRTGLITLQAAQETAALAGEQAEALGQLARLVQIQWEAGAVSPVEVSVARVAHQNALLGLKDAQRQEALARGQLAEAIGVPLRAFDAVGFSLPDISRLPGELAGPEIQREAVMNRADVLSALAEYSASESALQVQVARQYPDIHLRPGYELDQNKNKWQLGISVDLPVLHQNQGPIAEAMAKRQETAAKFASIQARAIGEIDRSAAVYAAAKDQASSADAMLADLQRRRLAMARMYEAGEVDRLASTSAQVEYLNGAQGRLRAYIQAQQALAMLENAVQVPLLMPISPAQMETAPRKPTPLALP